MVRIPNWWLSVGVDEAIRLQDLFAEVMAELPMAQVELAEKVDVDPSTVIRWAKGRTTPRLETMLRVVEEVHAHLEPLLRRATVVEKALRHVIAAEKTANAAGRSSAGWKEAPALKKLLKGMEK